MGVIVGTYIKPCLKIDSDGYKRYEIGLKIRPEFNNEGPASALLNTAGVPIPGTIWAYGDEVDASVWCSEECEIEPVVEDECVMYKASFSYTNKPKEGKYRRCNDERFDNPLLETPKVRVTYKGKKTKATKDRFGLQVKTSSHEIVRGSATEFDDFNAVVTIEQNVPVYVLAFNVGFINRVNDRFLYGMPPRTILCKNVEAEERFFGSCYKYWNRKVEFEIDYEGFDKDIVDEGTKVLKGAWSKDTRTWVVGTVDGQPANPYNPTHFDRFLDAKGNPAKVILDGLGKPFRPQITDKCLFCGYSAPQQYQVLGLFDTSLEGIGGSTALSSQSVILDHSGVVDECSWSGTYVSDGFGTVSGISLDLVDDQFILSALGDVWGCPVGLWNCGAGGNVLERANPTTTPRYVWVIDPNQPGSIRLEKYLEANFLLLDIPAYIGD